MAQRIILSIDPYATHKSVARKLHETLQALCRKQKFDIEPVYVVSPGEVHLAFSLGSAKPEAMVQAARKKLEAVIKSLKMKTLAPKVLFEKEIATSASAKTLAQYAKRQKVALTLCATGNHPGSGLLGLGSFCQSLSLSDAGRVIALPAAERSARNIHRILYATDYSGASLRGFQELLKLAKGLKAEVLVVHVYRQPISWTSTFPGPAGFTIPYPDVKDIQKDLERPVQVFEKLAKKSGVKVSFAFRETHKTIAEGILDFAKSERKLDMIALTAQSSSWVGSMLGTTTQRILNHSRLPVWFSHH